MTTDSPVDVKALAERLPGISSPVMRGDNLAILLASYFEPGIDDEEMDESETWKQGAIDAANEVLAAIHAHYATALLSAQEEAAGLEKDRDHYRNGMEIVSAVSRQNLERALEAESKLADAVGVLEPLAKALEDWGSDADAHDDEEFVDAIGPITFGHCRAARAFLTSIKETGDVR